MNWLHALPIRRKLTLVILLICATTLVIACGLLAAHEWTDSRRAFAREAAVLADVIGANSRAALSFDDEKAAREILAALLSDTHILTARLYRANGDPFAAYAKPGVAPATPRRLDRPDGTRFAGGELVTVRPIVHQGRRIGTLVLVADLERISARLWLFAIVSGSVILTSFLVALALSAWLQRPITGPILRLADAARAVAEKKDYSVRVPSIAGGEVGTLTQAFNEMLAGIAQRDAAVQGANEQLQRENRERLDAERRARAQVQRLSQINEITRAIAERQDVPSIFQAVVGNFEEQMPVDFACVCLHAPERNLLVVTSVGPRSAALAAGIGMPEKAEVRIDRNGLSRCVRGELVYEPNVTVLGTPFPQRLAAGGLGALVIAPLIVEAKVFGVLVAARSEPASFSSGDCEFLRQLSEHVALAAHQAQLYGALQRAYDDLRQTQQVVMQQERLSALGQMASGIAHDINNAVSPVSLYLESILEKETSLGAQSRAWLQTVQRAIDDVAHTVARMREFYRQREPQLSLVPVSINRIVEHVAELTRARWFDMPQQRGVVIDLQRELAAGLPAVAGVENEIREALINLVFNAVDALPRGGTLTLRTRLVVHGQPPAATSRVAVEVSDTGVGMTEETQRRCFEPFYTTKGERGTGLGLAMVYGIAKRHNADLELDSAPGRGTTVRLLLPIMSGGTVQFVNDVPARPGAPLRILVVDDDPLLVKSLSEILTDDGHSVAVASGGQAGINGFVDAQASGKPFDVVLTDLGMPYVDGRKVAAAVKAASPHTPVFLLTGWGNRLQVDGDIATDQILSKPPKLRDLREALARVTPPTS